MTKALVSILIPVYNAEEWLDKTIKSALNQTWKNIEVIIVDDGSTDNSYTIAKKFESPSVKVINQKNQGQSAAENRALKEAQGDFIQYLDADDLLAPDKIERQIRLLGANNSEFVAACEWGRFYKSPEDASFIQEAVWEDKLPVDWLICSWEGGGMMHGAAWLIPRKIAEKAGPWDETLSLINDFDYFSRVLLASQGVKFCWGAKTYYRSGISTSLSGANSPKAIDSAFRSLELGTTHLLARENSPRTRHACACAFQRFIYGVYPDMLELVQKAEAKVQLLGGCNLKPEASPLFKTFANIAGWKLAKRTQRLFYSVKSGLLSNQT